MNLPSEEQCRGLFQQYKVPRSILQHCQQVRRIAFFLAQKLRQKGLPLHPELVEKAAFLHDLFKTVALEKLDSSLQPYSPEEIAMWQSLREKYPQKAEGEVAYLVLNDDYPELALLLREFGDHQKTLHSWEEIVLRYADARVLRNKIVSLDERKSYVKQTYSSFFPFFDFDALFQQFQQHEQKIMKEINLNPEELAEKVENEN